MKKASIDSLWVSQLQDASMVGLVIWEQGITKASDSTGVGSFAIATRSLYLPGVAGAIIPASFDTFRSIGLYSCLHASAR